MKKIRIISVIFAMMFLAGFSQLNAQAEQLHFPQDISEFNECANDGIGEWVEGTIAIHMVINSNGGWMAHPQGQFIIGQSTGIKYRTVGASIERFNAVTENGATTYTFINRYHFVGKGNHFWVKGNYHAVENSNGLTITKDVEITTCK